MRRLEKMQTSADIQNILAPCADLVSFIYNVDLTMSLFKLSPILLLLVATMLTGCTHTREMSPDAVSTYSFEHVNETLEGRSVEVELTDERVIASKALRIQPDTTWTLDMLNGKLRQDPAQNISSIIWNRPGRGALEGAAIGALGGAVLGLATGFALASGRESEGARTSKAYYIAVPATFVTIIGIGTGTVLGVQKGSRDRYVYPQPPLNLAGSTESSSKATYSSSQRR